MRVRVRYAETDQMGVAHHAAYFVWFEAARSEFCRIRGIDYPALEASGLSLPVVDARCRYRAAARYDDELTVAMRILECKRSALRIEYSVDRDGNRIADGETVQMLVGRNGRPRSFPPELAAHFAPMGNKG